MEWPDDVLVAGNRIHDTRPRQTANPVTKIDVVGGRRWRVEANRVADFEKAGGDGVSYGAFLKGNSRDGVFARNLVVCADTHTGGARVGLSLGGGGSSPDGICEDGTCSPEHQGGTLVNNLVMRCSDVGVYLNEASDTRVLANTLYATAGIDVRFPASTATLEGNLLDGRVRERDGGTAVLGTNWSELDLTAVFADPDAYDYALLVDPGVVDALGAVDGLTEDFCGLPRDASPDGGAGGVGTDGAEDVRPHDHGAGGCGCAADAGGAASGVALWLGALLVGLRRRRRRAG
jgi:MYXO-CTERM domain-containing protein